MVVITNKEIYCKLIDIENHVMRTNGKVKLNRWISTTALMLITSLIFILISKLAIAYYN